MPDYMPYLRKASSIDVPPPPVSWGAASPQYRKSVVDRVLPGGTKAIRGSHLSRYAPAYALGVGGTAALLEGLRRRRDEPESESGKILKTLGTLALVAGGSSAAARGFMGRGVARGKFLENAAYDSYRKARPLTSAPFSADVLGTGSSAVAEPTRVAKALSFLDRAGTKAFMPAMEFPLVGGAVLGGSAVGGGFALQAAGMEEAGEKTKALGGLLIAAGLGLHSGKLGARDSFRRAQAQARTMGQSAGTSDLVASRLKNSPEIWVSKDPSSVVRTKAPHMFKSILSA